MAKRKQDRTIFTQIAKRISELMFERKALDIRVLDVHEITTMADFFVICSSESDPQTKAIVDHIRDTLRDEGLRPAHIEGYQHLNWVLMDYMEILVHVFHKDARSYYGIERLWADAKAVPVEDTRAK